VGCPSDPQGLSLAQAKSCDKLRCTGCDFRLLFFDDYNWTSKVDYLFFRNNMPDEKKLKKQLTRKKGVLC
jgi:hypothetical protein